MTKLLDKAIEKVRALPEAQQDLVASMIEHVSSPPRHQLTPEQVEQVMQAKASAAAGLFATDEEMEALWAKCGL